MTQPRPASHTAVPKSRLTTRGKVTIAVLAVVVVAALAVLVSLLFRPAPDPLVLPPVPGPTVTGPVPEPTIEPVERDKSTALLAAIPDTVLRWAVVAQATLDPAEVAATLNPGTLPVEAYELTYSDGTQELLLGASLWRTPEDAETAAANIQWPGERVAEPVLVNGEVVGQRYLLDWPEVDGSEPAQGVIWTNGSALFSVYAPPGQALPFYQAFGM